MLFFAPLIILQMECASQKKQMYKITNSMRSSALPVLQESPRPQPQSLQPPPQPEAPQLPPVAPIYAKHSLATSNQETQTPIATIPIECSPSAELRADNKKSISKESVEPEKSPEKEKDAGTTNGKGGGGRRGGGGGGGGREGANSTVGIDEKGGRKDDGFDECPDLTPDILKNIINDNC
ncbi:unnamed protein product [Brugia pahangi]|uniref:Uncharacterized protein n=1 Tax=Brugia pahangi TaxID=6280 RepID=A0A0N4TTE8_BRUPA|nr:unnamed protein product [Brugia pahangi]